MTPQQVVGDGNCLYRSVSLAAYGTEKYRLNSRLCMVLEMLENSIYYNINSRNFQDMIKDDRIIQVSFKEFCVNSSSLYAYADMICLFCVE